MNVDSYTSKKNGRAKFMVFSQEEKKNLNMQVYFMTVQKLITSGA
jgi:hypothetical protein